MYFTLANATYDLVQLCATESFTISFWFQLTNENVDRYFFSIGTYPTAGTFCWYRRNSDSPGRNIQVRSYSGGVSANMVSTHYFDDDAAHHFCLVVSGTGANEWKLYIDNVLEGQGSGQSADDSADAHFGDTGLGSGILTTTNTLDELSIWDTPLAANAIAALAGGAYYTG